MNSISLSYQLELSGLVRVYIPLLDWNYEHKELSLNFSRTFAFEAF